MAVYCPVHKLRLYNIYTKVKGKRIIIDDYKYCPKCTLVNMDIAVTKEDLNDPDYRYDSVKEEFHYLRDKEFEKDD